ncbi:MAG: very short patch repair endonuclease [Prevotella sp.]|nr:very short patch repair endonuclease [Prevotella sp.]
MDKVTPQQRHANMAAIHGKDTKPEMVVRRWLWRNGFRYRLNHPRLPGKPDIVMRKYRTCIFVNGCFWHGHHVSLPPELSSSDDACRISIQNSDCCKIPKTNRAFWVKKIRRNQERDIRVQRELALMGWHTITIWECELKPAKREETLQSLAYTLNKIFLLRFSVQPQGDDHQDHCIRHYEILEDEPMMAAENLPEYNEDSGRDV